MENMKLFLKTKKEFIKNFMSYNSEIKLTAETSNKIKLIDQLIFGFIILFLISITNSIFLNQIGYFFALILMVARWAVTKENKFEKTGLEIPFILFLSAELISAILSVNHPNAFTVLFKRLVLIPIIYVMVAASDDIEKAKTFFKFYIGAALITVIVYIAVAYEHFVAQLYQIESRGPSPFQYVMTAGGLMSFSTVILFAFLINEKTKLKFRILIAAAFVVSALALVLSYTRAAWIGAAAGMLVVLIVKRKWIFLGAGVAALIAMILLSKNSSKVFEYKINSNSIEKVGEFSTHGRAYNLCALGDTLFIADYENGISIRKGSEEIQNIKTVAPVSGIKKWKGNFYIGFLVDSRILLLEKTPQNKLKILKEFISPGRTVDYNVFDGKLYVQDVDSGLTVFTNPKNLKEKIYLKNLSGIKNISIDSLLFAGFDPIKNSLFVYSMESGIPAQRVDSVNIKSGFGFIWINGKTLYFQGENGLVKYYLEGNSIKKIASADLKSIFKMFFNGSNIIAGSVDGSIYELNSDSTSSLKYRQIAKLGFLPTDYLQNGQSNFVTQIKRNRLASIIDQYHDTNLERLSQWRTGWKILMAHPFFGVGDIDLKDVYAEYKDYYLKENFGHLHNNYVHFLVILGFVGFACVLFMLFMIFRLDLKIYKTVKDIPFISSYSLGSLAMFVGFLVSGLAEWNFGDQEIITMIWFTLGLNIAFYKNVFKTGEIRIDKTVVDNNSKG
jgi:hypothetical protein